MEAIIEENPIGNDGIRDKIIEGISISIEILVNKKLKDRFNVYSE